MPTPHNEAKKGQIAPVVLMPGDPLRAQYIAQTYLQDVEPFNRVRNMYGYTGTYKGKRISVMASGMGMPSIGIYSYELYKDYDVETILRIGTCGGYTQDLHVSDLLIVDSAWSESSYAMVQSGDIESIQYPDPKTNEILKNCADEQGIDYKTIRIHSSDVFYHEDDSAQLEALENGCVAVEMESFALFHNAKQLHRKAACLCTVSDSFVHQEELTSSQREKEMDKMFVLALESAISL